MSARLSTDLVNISHFRSNVLLYFVFLLWSINHCFQIIPKTIAVYAWLRVFTHPWYESVLKRWKWFIIVSVFGSVLIGILLSHFKIPHRFTTIFTQISKVFCIFDEEKKTTPLFSANKRNSESDLAKTFPDSCSSSKLLQMLVKKFKIVPNTKFSIVIGSARAYIISHTYVFDARSRRGPIIDIQLLVNYVRAI